MFELLGSAAGILVYIASYAAFVMEEDECSDGVRERSREKASCRHTLLYIKCFIGQVLFQERAYRYQAVVIGFVSVVSLMVTFFAVKEQKGL